MPCLYWRGMNGLIRPRRVRQGRLDSLTGTVYLARMLKSPFDLCIPSRVIKAGASIAVVLLLLISSGASATECQSSPGHDGEWWSWRIVDSKRCWYQGRRAASRPICRGRLMALIGVAVLIVSRCACVASAQAPLRWRPRAHAASPRRPRT